MESNQNVSDMQEFEALAPEKLQVVAHNILKGLRTLINDEQFQTLDLFLKFTIQHLHEHQTSQSAATLIQVITGEPETLSWFIPRHSDKKMPVEVAIDYLWKLALPYLPIDIRQVLIANVLTNQQLLLLGICLSQIPNLLSLYSHNPLVSENLTNRLKKAGFEQLSAESTEPGGR